MVIYTHNEQNSFHVTCCLTLFQYEIHSRIRSLMTSSHQTTTSLILLFWLWQSITEASTVCSRAASCWLVKKFFMMLKTLSADAKLGCTKRTFFTMEEQLGRFASFLDHHCSFSSSVCKSAPSATAKYLGSSAVSPCMMASLSRKRNLLNSSTEAAVGRSCWTCTGQHNLALRKARTFS